MLAKHNVRVDFHTHIIPAELPDLVAKYGDDRWPVIANKCECGADILIKGKTFRKITNHAWNPAKRIEDMDKEGIDIQVLSPIPVTFSYWSSPEAGLELAKYQNDFIASVVREYPTRFLGLGTVPLQDVNLAIVEMQRAVQELGLKGIEIGSNVNGLNLDDPTLYPFFEAAAHSNIPLFVHPWATLSSERFQKYNSMYTIGMPSETAVAAGSVISSGLLEKLPTLKICFAHGGGALPYLLPRMDKGWDVWPKLRTTEKPPSYYAKKLYYDTLVYDSINLQLMIDRLGVEQLVAGSDYPFLLREAPVGKAVEQLPSLTAEERNLLLGKNALTFLGL